MTPPIATRMRPMTLWKRTAIASGSSRGLATAGVKRGLPLS